MLLSPIFLILKFPKKYVPAWPGALKSHDLEQNWYRQPQDQSESILFIFVSVHLKHNIQHIVQQLILAKQKQISEFRVNSVMCPYLKFFCVYIYRMFTCLTETILVTWNTRKFCPELLHGITTIIFCQVLQSQPFRSSAHLQRLVSV